MLKRKDKNQVAFFERNQKFTVEINTENRWVQYEKMLPWDKIEEHYLLSMSETEGREGFSSQIAFGALFAKETLNLTDAGTVEAISENAYLQYFLGLHEFQNEPLFNSSMMTHFRERFTTEFISQINDFVATGKWIEKEISEDDLPPADEAKDVEHKGNCVLDATVAPADIRYPNDVLLLDECRENCEQLIEKLWEKGPKQGKKTPYNRNTAHKNTVNFIKTKKKTKKYINKHLGKNLCNLESAINQVFMLILFIGLDCLSDSEWERFDVICTIYLQQKLMFDNNTNRCDGKIMNLRQPHVRAICRNKAKAKYEYGQKLALSKSEGYVFIEHISWDNFNECNTLMQSVLNYYNRFGYFPEAVLADQIYHTKANIAFCKKYKIRLAGNGKTPKNSTLEEKQQAYEDQCKRNVIEGVNGVLKRRYGLDLIMCYEKHNAEIEASLQILAMNLQTKFRLFLYRLLNMIVFETFGLKRRVFQ